jgi:C4-dicarboxylate transporter DctM subunit
MIFASITGSSTAATSAIGSIMIPEMDKKAYAKGFTATLLACSGMLGPIIPPSNIMIIYCSITGLSVGALFMSGVFPGAAIGIALMLLSRFYARRMNIPLEKRSSLREITVSLKNAVCALLMPIIIMGGILSGVFTATEAGMVASFYGLIAGLFIYKGLRFRNLPGIFLEAAKSSASILLITGMAYITGWMLARLQFPREVMNFISTITGNVHVFLLLCIIFFMFLGLFMETVAIIVIFVPVLFPIANSFGMDPIHFACIMLVTLMIGQITPPVGILLFLTSSLSKISIRETFRYLPPFIVVMVVALLILAFFPDGVLFIPRLLYGSL